MSKSHIRWYCCAVLVAILLCGTLSYMCISIYMYPKQCNQGNTWCADISDASRKPLPVEPSPRDVVVCTYAERRMRMMRACERGAPVSEVGLPNLLVDHENRLLYCLINKVASTSLRKLLVLVKEKHSSQDVVAMDTVRYINLKKLPGYQYFHDLNATQQERLLKEYRSVVFVRHTLERLSSAYNFIFTHRNNDMLGKDSVARYKKLHPEIRRASPPGGDIPHHLTFPQFLDFGITFFPEKHWAPYEAICNPCRVKYDYIFKLETIEEDIKFLMEQLVAHTETDNLTLPRLNNAGSDARSPENPHRLPLYDTVPRPVLEAVRRRHGFDLQAFGYSWDERANTSHCGAAQRGHRDTDCC